MRRWVIFAVTALVLLLLATPLAGFYYAAFTEEGLSFVVRHLPKRIGSARLNVSGVRGTIANGLHIDRVEVEHERVFLQFTDIDGRIALPPMLLQTVRAPRINVRNAYVEIRRRATPAPTGEPRFLPRTLQIRADVIHIATGTLRLPNGRKFDLTNTQASGIARHKTIRIFDAEGTMDALAIAGDATLRAADPMEMEGEIRLTWTFTSQPPWVISTTAKGNLDVLALKSHFTSPLRAEFVGEALDLTSGWHWQGKAKIHDLNMRTWGGSDVLGRITGTLDVSGDASGFKGQGPLTPAGLKVGNFDSIIEGSYANRVVTTTRLELTHSSGAHATGSGTIEVVANGPRLALKGDWKNFRWPLVGRDPPLRSAAGTYELEGVWPYNLRGAGTLAVQDLQPMPFEMVGQLDKGHLLISQASVNAFDGQAQLSGEMTWGAEETWAAAGRATGINIGHFRQDLPGKLDFSFDAGGDGFTAASPFTVSIERIAGRLRDLPASGNGKVSHQDDVWFFENVHATLGGTSLTLDGDIDGDIDLRFGLQTQDLGLLSPDSRGELVAHGVLKGTLEEPKIDLTASGSAIRHKGVSVRRLDARVDFDARRVGESIIDIRARDVTYGERTIQQLTFALDGPPTGHTLKLDLSATGLKAQASAQGSFVKGIWRGQLTRLDVEGTSSLHLKLAEQTALMLSASAVSLERMCLTGSPAQLCARGDWNTQQWSGMLQANDLPLSTFTAGLTPGIDYRGTLNIKAQAFATASDPVQGNLRASLTDAQLSHRVASGRIEIITLGTGTVTGSATYESVVGEFKLDAGTVGTIAGEMIAQRTSNDWKDMPLMGELHAHTAEIDFLSLYLPQIDRAASRIEADLTASGTVGLPLVDGIIKLENGELDLYQVNLALRATELTARLRENAIEFDGKAQIGNGSAEAKGRLAWRKSLPYGEFNLTGDKLRIADIPEAQIDASPDLDFKIDGERIAVSGKVTIPHARIIPTDLTNAVRPSSDEIIVGEIETRTDRFQVVSNVTLVLGDQVNIDTSGLKGRLVGSITVRSGYEEVTRASGELNVEGGEYVAYARKLEIDRGRLIFTGGPVGNPGVDIRAVKKFPDVLAGVNVRGTLLQPRMTFFSEPSRPQSQIVQLILAGGSIQNPQNGNKGTAGTELLAQGGAILAQQLGSRVGLEDVSIEQNLSNETSLVLGKFLSPRLYVSYGISLTEQLNTLKLRYTLGDHWTIKTEFGEDGGGDLVYTIDK